MENVAAVAVIRWLCDKDRVNEWPYATGNVVYFEVSYGHGVSSDQRAVSRLSVYMAGGAILHSCELGTGA